MSKTVLHLHAALAEAASGQSGPQISAGGEAAKEAGEVHPAMPAAIHQPLQSGACRLQGRFKGCEVAIPGRPLLRKGCYAASALSRLAAWRWCWEGTP